MKISMAIKGVSQVIDAIENVTEEMRRKRLIALTRIGVKVKADAVENAPVITGNLRGSGYTDVQDDYVLIGFGAFYAPFVHENMEGRSPKFLERAVNENYDFILDELAKMHP